MRLSRADANPEFTAGNLLLERLEDGELLLSHMNSDDCHYWYVYRVEEITPEELAALEKLAAELDRLDSLRGDRQELG